MHIDETRHIKASEIYNCQPPRYQRFSRDQCNFLCLGIVRNRRSLNDNNAQEEQHFKLDVGVAQSAWMNIIFSFTALKHDGSLFCLEYRNLLGSV